MTAGNWSCCGSRGRGGRLGRLSGELCIDILGVVVRKRERNEMRQEFAMLDVLVILDGD